MQILKAEYGKSRVVCALTEQCNFHNLVVGYVENGNFLPENAYLIDDVHYSLKDVKTFIIDKLRETSDQHYDYLIVYTNLRESEIINFANELEKFVEGKFVRDIIVTCKPD